MRFLTAGESHGRALVGILDGMVRGVGLDFERIHGELERRRNAAGRSQRQSLECARTQFLSGVRAGYTTGAPIAMLIENADSRPELDALIGNPHKDALNAPRPAHADFAGCAKYAIDDARDIAERASGRHTAILTAIGAVAKELLYALGVSIQSHVEHIGGRKDIEAVLQECAQNGDSVGGKICVVAHGMPAGVGGVCQIDNRLDYALSALIGGIGGVKSVELGLGGQSAFGFGSNVHDQMYVNENKKICRITNNSGGIEGGISNGEDIVIGVSVKPVPTIKKPMHTVDLVSGEQCLAAYERSDICIVPAVAVVCEAMTAYCLADAILKKTGGDTLDEVLYSWKALRKRQR